MACMKKLSDRRIAAFFSLVLASGLCVALLAVRARYPHGRDFEFLTWNLFLAWIPFVLAVVLHDGARRGRGLVFLGTVGAVWLLFLPNAPYIVTDFVHVGRVTGVPVWYDAAMIASFAVVGLVLGLVSILLVQGVVERRFGAAVGWLMLAIVAASPSRRRRSCSCRGGRRSVRPRERRCPARRTTCRPRA
jgi:hypothetical protein